MTNKEKGDAPNLPESVVTDEMVERAAIALAGKSAWQSLNQKARSEYRRDARAALQAAMPAVRAANARAEGVEVDARRFRWWFSQDRPSTDEIMELCMREIANKHPSIDEWRAAIDAAQSAHGETK